MDNVTDEQRQKVRSALQDAGFGDRQKLLEFEPFLNGLYSEGYHTSDALQRASREGLTTARLPASLIDFVVQSNGGRQLESNKGSHAGRASAQGSPAAPVHKPPSRSVAFGSAVHQLTDYCPRLKVKKFNKGMRGLRSLRGFEIQPRAEGFPNISTEVLAYFLPLLQRPLLGREICTNNEASSVLRIYEIIKRLLRSCPFIPAPTQHEEPPGAQSLEPGAQPAAVQFVQSEVGLVQSESDKFEVVAQEGTSPRYILQQIAHEQWQHVPGFVKGRVELQIKCETTDGKFYLLGACEVASDLHTPEKLNAKLQQVAKETLAFAINNVLSGVGRLPVKMLLSDGKWFMRVDFVLKTGYEEGMDLVKLEGDFSYSAAYPLIGGKFIVKEDSYDAVRLLLTWLWDGPWEQLSKESVENAWKAAEDHDDLLLAAEKQDYAIEEDRVAKRRKLGL